MYNIYIKKTMKFDKSFIISQISLNYNLLLGVYVMKVQIASIAYVIYD